MFQFLGQLLASIENLFAFFSPRRFMSLVLFLTLVLIVFLIAENLTGFVFFGAIERKISLLKGLNSLAHEGINQDPQLSHQYEELLNQVSSYKIEPISFRLQSLASWFHETEHVWKFLSGAFLLITLAVLGVLAPEKHEKVDGGWGRFFVGMTTTGIALGIVGALIPNMGSPIVNVIAYPFIEILLFAVLIAAMELMERRK